ncbi:MAG: type II restriction endonuclease [Fermentimonas sp.]|jgi:type II restriction enzyme
MRDFDAWISSFRPSIADYRYYTDFKKVLYKVESIKIPLNILNALIGSQNIEREFAQIVEQYPETLKCIPILLAKREYDIMVMDEEGQINFFFDKPNRSIEDYTTFMRKTGLFELMENHHISDLVDYVTGVEVGLDTNARKNRGGHLMENLVERFLCKAGLVRNLTYFKEMKLSEIEHQFGLNLSSISNKGNTEKRFDFVIKSGEVVFAIETNFYSSSGSKLNETARSYKNIALESKGITNFEFVWFTDGWGWHNAKNNLKETFDIMEHLYNISDLENDIILKLIS